MSYLSKFGWATSCSLRAAFLVGLIESLEDEENRYFEMSEAACPRDAESYIQEKKKFLIFYIYFCPHCKFHLNLPLTITAF